MFLQEIVAQNSESAIKIQLTRPCLILVQGRIQLLCKVGVHIELGGGSH